VNSLNFKTLRNSGAAPVIAFSAERENESGRVAVASRITKHSSIAMLGGLLSQGLKFVVVIYVARKFSTVEFGWFSFAVAVNAYMSIMSNFGLPVFGSRAIAKSGMVAAELLTDVVSVRLLLSAIVTLLGIGVLSLIPEVNRVELMIVALFGLSNLPQAWFFDWVFQGLDRQGSSAALNVAWQAGWLLFTIIACTMGLGIIAVGVGLSLSTLVASTAGYYWLRSTPGLISRNEFAPPLLSRAAKVFRAAAPLGFGTMLISVVVWTDAIYVRLLNGEVAVAVYAAGNRAALALSMLGTFYVQGAFPLLSRASIQSRAFFEQCFTQVFADLAILFVPCSVWAIYYAREIIWIVFRRPEFAAALPVFRIFQVTLLLFVLNNLLGTGVLVAYHRDRAFRRVLVGSTAAFLFLCPLLTWRFGNVGAAISVLLSQVIALTWFYRYTCPLLCVRWYRAVRWPLALSAACVALCFGVHLSFRAGLFPLFLTYIGLLSQRSFEQPGTALA